MLRLAARTMQRAWIGGTHHYIAIRADLVTGRRKHPLYESANVYRRRSKDDVSWKGGELKRETGSDLQRRRIGGCVGERFPFYFGAVSVIGVALHGSGKTTVVLIENKLNAKISASDNSMGIIVCHTDGISTISNRIGTTHNPEKIFH